MNISHLDEVIFLSIVGPHRERSFVQCTTGSERVFTVISTSRGSHNEKGQGEVS